MDQGDRCRVEYDEAAATLSRCAEPVVPKSELDREVALHLPGVQGKTAYRVDENPARAVRAVRCKLTGLIVDERRNAREQESAGGETEIVIVDPAIFASELEGVIAAIPTHRIRRHR